MGAVPRRRIAYIGNSAPTLRVFILAGMSVALLLATIFIDHERALWVIWPVMSVCFGSIAYREWRNRVGFDGDGLVVGGPRLAHHVIAWSDVDRFEVRRELRELGVRTSDDRWIHLQTYAKGNVDMAYRAASRLEEAQRQTSRG